jgi:hypothetical protein
MNKIAMIAAVSLALTACGPEHIRDEVREVETGDTIVSDGWTDVVFQGETDPKVSDPNALALLDENSDPELYVKIKDISTGEEFKVWLGYECNRFPIPKGARFLAKFDIMAYEKSPKELYIRPYSEPINKYLCS